MGSNAKRPIYPATEWGRAATENCFIRHGAYQNLLLHFDGSVWHARWRRNKEHIRPGESIYRIVSTRESDFVAACNVAAEKYEGRHAAAAVKFKAAGEAWLQWGRSRKGKRRSETALVNYRKLLDRKLIPLLGDIPVEEVSDSTMEAYRRKRWAQYEALPEPLKRSYGLPSDETHHKETQVVLAILDFVERIGVNGKPIRLKFKAPALLGRCDARRATIDDDKCERLFALADERARAARRGQAVIGRQKLAQYIRLLRYSGLRPGEARKLRIGDVGQNTVMVKGKLYVPIRVEFPKNNTPKRIALADIKVRAAVASILSSHPTPLDKAAPLFVTRTGWREWRPSEALDESFGYLLQAMAKREPGENWLYEIDPLGKREARTLYSFRHAYATAMISVEQMYIPKLALVMGTSLAYIEKHYYHPLRDHLTEQARNAVEGVGEQIMAAE